MKCVARCICFPHQRKLRRSKDDLISDSVTYFSRHCIGILFIISCIVCLRVPLFLCVCAIQAESWPDTSNREQY